MLLFIALLLGSCQHKNDDGYYSENKSAGKAKLTMIVDADTVSSEVVANTFFMRLMTVKDTFLVKPSNQELVFPKLADTLTAVDVRYNDWEFTAANDLLKNEYSMFYYPGDSVTVVIDEYPFTEEHALIQQESHKNQLFFEIRKKNMRLFMGYMNKLGRAE